MRRLRRLSEGATAEPTDDPSAGEPSSQPPEHDAPADTPGDTSGDTSADAPADAASASPAQAGEPAGETPGETPAEIPAADALEHLRQLNVSSGAVRGPEAPDNRTPTGDPEGASQQADALERLKRLNETIRARTVSGSQAEGTPTMEATAAQPSALERVRGGLPTGRLLKTLLALIALVAIAWVPVMRLLTSTSAEATINARLINVRAPIDGKVSIMVPSLAVGTFVKPGETLMRIDNVRANRQRLDDLRRTANSLKSEIAAQKRRIDEMKKIRDDASVQRNAFQSGRVRQLESRRAELAAELKAAEAQRDDALKSLKRSQDLKERGYQTTATLLHAERDHKVSISKVEAAHKRLEGNSIELEAARKGLFVGDSYNDLPRSAQRLDELEQKLAELASELHEREARLEFVEKERIAETALFAEHSEAAIDATVSGRVWEVFTSGGEEVRAGQDLLRILDCGGAAVTATVSESVYNSLWIGQAVEFQLRGESRRYAGKVAALTGLTPAESNFAINQTALKREPYHVTISVPGLSAREQCSIGRSGNVTFKSSAAPAPNVSGVKTAAEAVKLGHASSSFFAKISTSLGLFAVAVRKAFQRTAPEPARP